MKPLVMVLSLVLLTSCMSDNTFDLRSKCSALANSFEAGQRSKFGGQAEFTNHYDAESRKCYVEVTGLDQESVEVRDVFDAQEQRLMIRCLQYKGKPTCDQDGKVLTPAEGAALANKLMGESKAWP